MPTVAPGPRPFLTNHAQVLACLAADPAARMRDVAARLGLTERAVQNLVAELAANGFVSIAHEGRRNRYTVHLDRAVPNGSFPEIPAKRVIAFLRGGPLAPR
jgi:hypothetical protein